MLLKRHKQRIGMNVIFEGKLWKLDCPRLLFKRLQREQPNLMVEIIEQTCSIFSERRRVRISELKTQ